MFPSYSFSFVKLSLEHDRLAHFACRVNGVLASYRQHSNLSYFRKFSRSAFISFVETDAFAFLI